MTTYIVQQHTGVVWEAGAGTACPACDGSGAIPRGSFGSYRRDGEQYDAPGVETCEECDGTGGVR